jgi:hypothetical protein
MRQHVGILAWLGSYRMQRNRWPAKSVNDGFVTKAWPDSRQQKGRRLVEGPEEGL